MTEKERMDKGLVYRCDDEEIHNYQRTLLDTMFAYNQTLPSDGKTREALLPKMFAAVGKDCFIEAPFHANWGGHHVTLGNGVYANFNLTLVDDGNITIGDHTLIAPNVTIATAGHPILPWLREMAAQYNRDVAIGKNVWIGAGSVILPGVTIGDNTVIGAGSVVAKSIPANVVAVGNPCRVLREIGEKDEKCCFHNELYDADAIKRYKKQK